MGIAARYSPSVLRSKEEPKRKSGSGKDYLNEGAGKA